MYPEGYTQSLVVYKSIQTRFRPGTKKPWTSTSLQRTSSNLKPTQSTFLRPSTSPPVLQRYRAFKIGVFLIIQSTCDVFFFRQGSKNLNGNAREINGGPVTGTTERIIEPEKNDKTHSTPKVETADDQLGNRNSIFGGNNRVNNNKLLSTIFPTFATHFNFPDGTTPLPESTTRKVDVEKLEKELFDVLDRLAQSYTDSTDSK